jgi:hypothetical protein
MLNGLRPGPKGCHQNTSYFEDRHEVTGEVHKFLPAIFSVAFSYHSIDLYRCPWWKLLSTIRLACVIVGILLQAASVWIS